MNTKFLTFHRVSQVRLVLLVQQVYRVNQGYQVMMVYRDVLAKLGLKGIQVSQEILEENLESFLTLADSYDVAPLKLQVEEAAVKLLTTENMVDMFYWGDLYHATQLKEAAEFLISRNKEVLKEMDFSRFPANFITAILKVVC